MFRQPEPYLITPISKQDHARFVHFVNGFTKDRIMQMAKPFYAMLTDYVFMYPTDGDPVPAEIYINPAKPYTNKKDDWANFLAIFLNDVNFHVLTDQLSPTDARIFRSILLGHYLEDDEKLDAEIETAKRNGPVHFENYALLVRGRKNFYAWRDTQYYAFPSGLTPFLLNVLFPECKDVHPLEQLPEGESLHTFNVESLIFALVPTLKSLYECRSLPVSFRKLPVSTLNKVAKTVKFPRLFPDAPSANKPDYAFSLMVNTITVYMSVRERTGIPLKPDLLLYDLLDTYPTRIDIYSVLLPELKGLRLDLIYGEPGKTIFSLLRLQLARCASSWQSVDDVVMRLRMSSERGESAFLHIAPDVFERMHLENKSTKQPIHKGNQVEQISMPIVRSLLMVMAVFGAVEVAYTDPQPEAPDVMSGLKYVRLTEFGRFLVGLTDNYESPHVESPDLKFEVDDQRLFVRMPSPDNPYRQLLMQMATSVSPSLFVVSEKSFLSDCDNAEDIMRKISQFREFVCRKPPQVWEDFFHRLLSHCQCMKPASSKYVVYQVPPADAELHRLLFTDEKMRELVVKAEGYKVLVEYKNLARFRDALKSYGYLL